MLAISRSLVIPDDEIEIHAIKAQGSGGQNVNKVSTAIHLRFDIPNSSLPDFLKERLCGIRDKRISSEGVIVIKAQRYRSQEKNRAEALSRLQSMIESALQVQKPRKPTRPGKAARMKRVDQKTRRGKLKDLRGKPAPDQ